MSRTYRNISDAHLNSRRIRYRNQRLQAISACDEMRDEGYNPRPRDKAISRYGYLNQRDDYNVAAYSETKPLTKKVKEFLDNKYGFCTYTVWSYFFSKQSRVKITVTVRAWDHVDYDYYFAKFERSDKLKKRSRR